MADDLTYPAARVSDHTDVYFGTTVADPYRWMEDVDSAEVKQWVDAENQVTQAFLADVPQRAKIHARLMELVNFERFSAPELEGGRYFYQRNSGLQNQAVLYWQQGEGGEPKVLLDPNTLTADGTVALGATSVSDDGKLLAYSLAEAGSDLNTIHVRDVATGNDLPDEVGWVKFSGVSWLKDGSGFFYSSFGVPKTDAEKAEALKAAAYFHKLYLHKLGTPQTDDVVVFERPDDKEMTLAGGVSEDGSWLAIYQGKISKNALAVKDLRKTGWEQENAPVIRIAPLDDAAYDWIGNQEHEVWVKTNKDAPNSKIVKVDLHHPTPEKWVTVVPETSNSLESAVMVGGKLILTYLVDARSEVELRKLNGALIERLNLPGIGSLGVHGGKRTDTRTFYTFTNYTTPATVYELDLTSYVSTVWKQPKLTFDPAQFETTQVFATSKDGTRVPLFLTYRKGTLMDGTAPTILYGYGGFSVSLGPGYSSSRLAWLEMGGVYAEAILRGGGEYGEDWHEAGTRLKKQNVFDDFIACAEYLVENKYTSPAKLAVNGGSNGGLLVAAVSLQRPELFGAAVAQVGVMDMLRFDKFTIGYAWKPDYGSPSDNEAEFRSNLKFSPVHNIHAGTRYPAMLITTADHDDRVFPAHSFKFAAQMQAAAGKTPVARPVLIRVETRAGHGAGMPLSKQMDATADMYAFLVKELGMEDKLSTPKSELAAGFRSSTMARIPEVRTKTPLRLEDDDLQVGAGFAAWFMRITVAALFLCAGAGIYFSKSWELVHDAPLLHYVVFLMDHGRAPYRNIVEMNMPGAYMAEWLIIHTLGSGAFAWWLADLIAGCVGILASVWIAGSRHRMAGVAAGTLTYLVHLANGPAETGQRDWMVAILLLVGFGFLFETMRRGRPAWITGFVICSGLAASIKPPALAVGLLFIAVVCWLFWREGGPSKHRWRAVLGYSLLGSIFPAALVMGFLLRWGVTSEFLYSLHTLVPWYAGLGRIPLVILLRRSLAMRAFFSGSFVLFVANRARLGWQSAFLLGGAFCGWMLVIVQQKGWAYHLYPELVFLSLWGMLELQRGLQRGGWMRLVAAMTLVVTIAVACKRLWAMQTEPYPLVTIENLQRDLNALGGAKLSGRIQCLDVTMGGCINVLYRMKLVQSTGFIYDTYLFPEKDTALTQSLQNRFRKEIDADPPEVIVLSSHAWPRADDTYATLARFPAFQQELVERYRLAKEFPIQPRSSGYRIYVLKP